MLFFLCPFSNPVKKSFLTKSNILTCIDQFLHILYILKISSLEFKQVLEINCLNPILFNFNFGQY